MDTQIPELFPKMSILPPLSITGVECPVPFSYNCENGFQIRPPASLHSVPFRSFRKLPMLRFASQRSDNAKCFPTHCTPLRSAAKGTSLRYAAFCTPLRSTRSATLRSFPPQGFACRSASLRFTLHNWGQLCAKLRMTAVLHIIPVM